MPWLEEIVNFQKCSFRISFIFYFLSFFSQKTELEISDSAFAAIPKYAPYGTKTWLKSD